MRFSRDKKPGEKVNTGLRITRDLIKDERQVFGSLEECIGGKMWILIQRKPAYGDPSEVEPPVSQCHLRLYQHKYDG